MDTDKICSSVAIFRLRCHRLMHIWSREWLAAYRGSKATDVARWMDMLQKAYTNVLKRGPSIAEWVADISCLSRLDNVTQDAVYSLIKSSRACRSRSASALVLVRPYLFRLHRHKFDMDAALQEWSRDVGQAFLKSRRCDVVLPVDYDWTDPAVIARFIARTKYSPGRFYLTQFLERCKMFWKGVIMRRTAV